MRRYFDFANTIALFHLGMLHHHNGEPSPQSIIGEYIDALPSGSYVAIGHFSDPETTSELSGLARKLEEVFLLSPLGAGKFRTTDHQAAATRSAPYGRSGRPQTLNSAS